jgi:hypothetical protein
VRARVRACRREDRRSGQRLSRGRRRPEPRAEGSTSRADRCGERFALVRPVGTSDHRAYDYRPTLAGPVCPVRRASDDRLDATIVTVALPSIQADLGLSQSSLAWVVNAYLIAFAGLLLLAGRLGDLVGQRRVFLVGLAVFTAASLACALARSQGMLIAARFVQGAGGAISSAVILGMIVTMFPEPREQARAMGVYTPAMKSAARRSSRPTCSRSRRASSELSSVCTPSRPAPRRRSTAYSSSKTPTP